MKDLRIGKQACADLNWIGGQFGLVCGHMAVASGCVRGYMKALDGHEETAEVHELVSDGEGTVGRNGAEEERGERIGKQKVASIVAKARTRDSVEGTPTARTD